jgi:plastocyanin
MRSTVVAVSLALAAVSASAGEFVITQKDKAFAPGSLKIKVGDSVLFKNEDGFAHNVFSLSDPKSFDLGSYGKGESKTVVFDKPGTVEVECAIHPNMKMNIEVAK